MESVFNTFQETELKLREKFSQTLEKYEKKIKEYNKEYNKEIEEIEKLGQAKNLKEEKYIEILKEFFESENNFRKEEILKKNQELENNLENLHNFVSKNSLLFLMSIEEKYLVIKKIFNIIENFLKKKEEAMVYSHYDSCEIYKKNMKNIIQEQIEFEDDILDDKKVFIDCEKFLTDKKSFNKNVSVDSEKLLDNLNHMTISLKNNALLSKDPGLLKTLLEHIDISKKCINLYSKNHKLLLNAETIYLNNEKLKIIDEKLKDYLKKIITVTETLLKTKKNFSFFDIKNLCNKVNNIDLDIRIIRTKREKIINEKDSQDSIKEIQELQKDIKDIIKKIQQRDRNIQWKIL